MPRARLLLSRPLLRAQSCTGESLVRRPPSCDLLASCDAIRVFVIGIAWTMTAYFLCEAEVPQESITTNNRVAGRQEVARNPKLSLGRAIALAVLLTSAPARIVPSADAGASAFRIEEATIDSIQSAIQQGNLTTTQVVQTIPEPHQGVRRPVRESAGRHPGTVHHNQACRSDQLAHHGQPASGEPRGPRAQSSEGAEHDRPCRQRSEHA